MDEKTGAKKTEEEFHVVDRRRFGQGEDAANEQDGQTPERTQQAQPAPRDTAEHHGKSEHDRALPPVDFSSFVVSLATQSMILLGELPDPVSHQTMFNLEAAKQTIDILGILEDKTKGNLSDEERRLLDDALASLRLAYVKKVREKGRAQH